LPHRLSYRCPTTIFLDPATDTDIISAQHFWTGGPETTGLGCYDAVRDRSGGGFRMLYVQVFGRWQMTRPATRLEPAKTERPKYPEKSLPTTTAEQMGETLAELPFTGDQVVCLGGDHLWCV